MSDLEPFDAARYLTSPDAQEDLLNDALASGNARYLVQSLRVIARVRGVNDLASKAGVIHKALPKLLSEAGDLRLSTLLNVLRALGIRLSASVNPH